MRKLVSFATGVLSWGIKRKHVATHPWPKVFPTTAHLEGFPALDLSSTLRQNPTKGKAEMSTDIQRNQRKISPIKPRNLLVDLDAGLVGTGTR